MKSWLIIISILIPMIAVAGEALPATEDEKEPLRDDYPEPDSARMSEVDRYQDPTVKGSHFEWTWMENKLEPWQNVKDHLNENYGIDFFFAYSPQWQAGTQDNKKRTIAHEADFIGEWRMVESDDYGKGRLQWWFLHVQTLGNHRGGQFQSGNGSGWELNDIDTGGSDSLNAIGLLNWEHLAFDDHFRVVAGKLDPRLLMNTNRFLWDDRVFFNFETLASDPVVGLNGSRALGTFAEFNHSGAYVSGIWVDADSNVKSLDFRSIDNGNYSYGVEVGYETEIGDLGEGNYRGAWTFTDRTSNGKAGKSMRSYSVSADQDLGENLAAFFYWSTRDGRKGSLKQNLSAGLVLRKPFGIAHDHFGLGFSWGKPDGTGNGDDQYGLEAFYRAAVLERLEVTPIVQWIIDPVSSQADHRLVGGLRARLYF